MEKPISLLMIGDIAGKPGMKALKRRFPGIVAEHEVDFTVANGENLAGGLGITRELCESLLELGVDCVTTGNHVWRQSEIQDYIAGQPRLLRPFNYPSGQPGAGFGLFGTNLGIQVGVINLVGRVFMDPADSPFDAADRALASLGAARVVLVDFHAEATSEKRALGFHLAGRVTAVAGTHTHVQTADEQLLEGGTAYISDLGMTGPHDSIIGMRKDIVLDRFLRGMPHAFALSQKGPRLQAALIRADRQTGRAIEIRRIDLPAD